MANRSLLNAIAAVCGLAAIAAANPGPVEAKTVVIQRTTIYVATLPKGCVKMNYPGFSVWKCGTVYYELYRGRYVRVYIK